MKKIIRLTESDLTRIVRRVINEQTPVNYPAPENDIELPEITVNASRYGKLFKDIISQIFYDGNKSSKTVQSKFDSVASLIVNNLRQKEGKKVGMFYPEAKIHKQVFKLLNDYLNSTEAGMDQKKKGYISRYPNLSTNNIKDMIQTMGLDGSKIFGEYWDDYPA